MNGTRNFGSREDLEGRIRNRRKGGRGFGLCIFGLGGAVGGQSMFENPEFCLNGDYVECIMPLVFIVCLFTYTSL